MSIPGYNRLRKIYQQLSPLEFGVFIVGAVMLVIGAIGVLGNIQSEVSTTVPTQGGNYQEGIIGFPRYINPVLASTNSDKDVTALVYAGLTKLDESGNIELDLASDMEVSSDGERYTFTIREDARFHDGHPVLAEDVVYTINTLQDQRISSPRAADWNGVQVQAIDERTVEFRLANKFSDFAYNARIGILPKHQWRGESAKTFPFSSLNTDPVGSGPYKIVDIERDDEGTPTDYQLAAAETYPNTPYISEIHLTFFADESDRREAFADNFIEAMQGIDPVEAAQLEEAGEVIVTRPLNRVFAVFFNQNNNQDLAEIGVRQALAQAVPKAAIVQDVLYGYGNVIDGPLPPSDSSELATSSDNSLETASQQLEEAGWVMKDGQRVKDGEQLSISLATANIASLQETANQIANRWKDLGVEVSVISLPATDLSREVIRPRNYEALLFGQSLNQTRDLYPFWHSSQRDDPGLNLAMYARTGVDASLETYRKTDSDEEKTEIIDRAIDTITADQAAIFIYSPSFIYALPEKISRVTMPPITDPADRFAQIEEWYIKTNKLWDVFLDGETDTGSATSPTSTEDH